MNFNSMSGGNDLTLASSTSHGDGNFSNFLGSFHRLIPVRYNWIVFCTCDACHIRIRKDCSEQVCEKVVCERIVCEKVCAEWKPTGTKCATRASPVP